MFFTILFPLIFLIIMGGLFQSGGAPQSRLITIGAVPMIDLLPAQGRAEVDKVLQISRLDDAEQALTQVRNGDAAAAVQQRGDQVVMHFSAADTTSSGIVRSVMEGIIQAANLATTGQPPRFSLTLNQVENKALPQIQYLTPGILGWAIATGATFTAASTLVLWREKRILRRLTLTPVRFPAVTGARVLVSLGIALAQTVIFLAVAVGFFGLKLASHWWTSIPLILAGTLAFLAIGLLAGAKAKSVETANAVSNLIVIPMAFLSGSFFPLSMAPQWLQNVAEVFPLRHLNTGMLDSLARGLDPAAILPELGILLGFAAVITTLAVWLFRWNDI
ncbi:ABC transporter permease [Rhizohabitans arisaemae]|uniref:ABC transporter permease n=1 Tax=Rhizohabitans arisaemae TaxID=2720610 RepID=UPI0024B226D6|nr:ABC transporter permease [Rhizohabitans arisaemae]